MLFIIKSITFFHRANISCDLCTFLLPRISNIFLDTQYFYKSCFYVSCFYLMVIGDTFMVTLLCVMLDWLFFHRILMHETINNLYLFLYFFLYLSLSPNVKLLPPLTAYLWTCSSLFTSICIKFINRKNQRRESIKKY